MCTAIYKPWSLEMFLSWLRLIQLSWQQQKGLLTKSTPTIGFHLAEKRTSCQKGQQVPLASAEQYIFFPLHFLGSD